MAEPITIASAAAGFLRFLLGSKEKIATTNVNVQFNNYNDRKPSGDDDPKSAEVGAPPSRPYPAPRPMPAAQAKHPETKGEAASVGVSAADVVSMLQPAFEQINTMLERLHDAQEAHDALLPVGSIIAWHNRGVPNVRLPNGWVSCEGQTIRDVHSPFDQQLAPDLNKSGRFLRGGAVSGTLQDAAFARHSHGGATHGDAPALEDSAHNVMRRVQMCVIPDGRGIDTGHLSYSDTTHGLVRGVNCASHTHGIPQDGGDETRPINMSVIYIMRIK